MRPACAIEVADCAGDDDGGGEAAGAVLRRAGEVAEQRKGLAGLHGTGALRVVGETSAGRLP